MCGITGMVDFKNKFTEMEPVLHKMCSSIIHRGPNDSGIYVDGNVGIGMRRLSIIDVKGGHQPVANEDETAWIVFNGEIYNYLNLRKMLIEKGHKFKTNSDTETIIHLYEEKGEECVNYLRGMFAFAIWDRKNKKLFIARDRLGIKPLYYSCRNDVFLFGSEIKTLLATQAVSKEINWSALDYYFTLAYIPSPYSIFTDIKKLYPGHTIVVQNNKVAIKKYWDVQFKPDYKKKEEDFIEEFITIFNEAVKIRLQSEVPLGAFLSGGIDSSLIVAFMAENSDRRVNTFSMGFGGNVGGFNDERKYAQLVAERYNTIHTELETLPNVEEILDHIVSSFDEPFADDSVIPSFYICKEAVKHVTVALTGLGGDELFAGYERYLGLKLDDIYSRFVPSFIRKSIALPLVSSFPELKSGNYQINHMKRFVRNSVKPESKRYLGYLSILSAQEKEQFYNKDIYNLLDKDIIENEMLTIYNASGDSAPLNKALYLDIKTYLPEEILTLTDRLSMAHSLEIRVPFIDHELVELCATIPPHFKINKFSKKYLLKKISEKYLPEEILNHKKQGFAAPMTAWLKKDLKPLVEDRLSPANLSKHNFFNEEFIKKKIKSHVEEREINDKFIFSLLVFQHWYEKYLS